MNKDRSVLLVIVMSAVIFMQCEAYISEERLAESKATATTQNDYDSRELELQNKIFVYTPVVVTGVYDQPFLYPSESNEKWYMFDGPGDYPSGTMYSFPQYHVIAEGLVSQMGDGRRWHADRLVKISRFKEKILIEDNGDGR